MFKLQFQVAGQVSCIRTSSRNCDGCEIDRLLTVFNDGTGRTGAKVGDGNLQIIMGKNVKYVKGEKSKLMLPAFTKKFLFFPFSYLSFKKIL